MNNMLKLKLKNGLKKKINKQMTEASIFQTNRMNLRLPTMEDVDNLCQMDSNPNVMKYIGTGVVKTRQETIEYLEKAVAMSDGNTGYWIAEENDTGDFIGWFVLKQLENTPDFELGYRLVESQWGKGFATEGAKFIVHHAFHTLKMKKILALTLPEHKVSQNVLRKAGLEFAGKTIYYNLDVDLFQIVHIIDEK